MLEQVSTFQAMEWAAGRNCRLWSAALAGLGFLERPMAHGGPVLGQPVPEGLYSWKRLMVEQFLKNHSVSKGPTLARLMKGCNPWEAPCSRAGEHHEQEGEADMKTNHNLHSASPPCSPVGRSSLFHEWNRSWEEKKGWREGGFSIDFISHYHTLLLSGNKLFFPKLGLFYLWH